MIFSSSPGIRHFYDLVIINVLVLLSLSGCEALAQQIPVVARCIKWFDNKCTFAKPSEIKIQGLNVTTQTVCKADVAASVKQIDWASPSGGKGSVKSFTVNHVELLQNPIYPSDAYVSANYPHCDDMYSIFPPYGNGLVASGGRHDMKYLVKDPTISFDIVYQWEGSHEFLPVCSLSGVSFGGYAEINFYIEAQENRLCPGWDLQEKLLCSGHGKCTCAPVDGSPRTCTCQPGYGGTDCKDCLDTFYGPGCEIKCEPCLNGGRCHFGEKGNGSCICQAGFDPFTRCATCLPGFFGTNCQKCPDCNFPHGNCEDGLTGSGRCSCAVGFDPLKNCNDCMENFYGDSCTPCKSCDVGHCNHGLDGDGECVCPEGFSPESRCLECASNYYGKSCTPCRSCNNHGRCNDKVTGDGSCICDEGYTTESRCSLCDQGWDFNPITMSCQCAPNHFGPHCISCPICAPHGHCNSGMEGDGRCICDVGWSDSNNCVGCMNGYYSEKCILCKKCGEGRCDDGLRGTGACNCHQGWSTESDCYDCEEGFYGESCNECPLDCGRGRCSSGINGTGECICKEGWNLHTKSPCTSCLFGYIGPDCKICPGFSESALPCNGHGRCELSGTEAVCRCDPRYSGAGCDIYDFPFMMVAILGSIALSTLGFCMCTMRRLARQPRHMKGPFFNRGNSFSRSEYVEISGMNDLELFVSNDSKDWLIPFESLTLQCEVGNGTSGQVFRSLFHSGGGSSVVAVKRLYSPVTGQEYFQSFFRREVSILSRLHHPNVVRFYGVSYYNRVLYIVTDFCPKSLSHLIENPNSKGQIEEKFFMKIIHQIVSGMGFLHSRNVVHRDLKPANVLISETDDVNICDFGLSRLIDPEMTSMTAEVGTPSYMAPEMATMGGIQCSTKGDVYSFGILLYSTWSRSKPYGDQGMNPFQLMTAVVNGLRPVIPINCPPGLARLMRACWDASPDNRPTFPEIALQLKDQFILQMTEEVATFDVGSVGLTSSINSTTSTAIFRRSSKDGFGSQGSVNNYGSMATGTGGNNNNNSETEHLLPSSLERSSS